jgi:hypothetical protein
MTRVRFALWASLVLGLVAAGCAGDGSSDEPLPTLTTEEQAGRLARWDQERVTRIATELATAADSVQDELRKQPTPTLGSGQYTTFYRLQQSVRRARLESKQLAAMLQEGKGYAETLPVYEGLRQYVADSAEEARKAFVQEPLMAAITGAGDLLNQLAPYYDPKALSGG